MMYWMELLTVIGSFIGTAFAIIRLVMAQNRAMTERFVSFLEQSIRRQESINEGFREAIEKLTTCVGENSHILNRLSERLKGGS